MPNKSTRAATLQLLRANTNVEPKCGLNISLQRAWAVDAVERWSRLLMKRLHQCFFKTRPPCRFSSQHCAASSTNDIALTLSLIHPLPRQPAMRVPSSPAASPAAARSYEPLDFGEDAEEERKPSENGRLSLIASRIWRGARPLVIRSSSSKLLPATRPTRDAGTCAPAVSAPAPQ
jgi:hypothetical protein